MPPIDVHPHTFPRRWLEVLRATASRPLARAAVVALLCAGCAGPAGLVDPGAGSTIPPGAQVVHVTVTESAVSLAPAIVRPGPVYLILEASSTGSVMLIGGAGPNAPANAPLAAGAIERLGRGDVEGTSMTGLDAGGCGPAQDQAGRGRLGPCGNVGRFELVEGTYALTGEAPESRPSSAGALPIGILTVTP